MTNVQRYGQTAFALHSPGMTVFASVIRLPTPAVDTAETGPPHAWSAAVVAAAP